MEAKHIVFDLDGTLVDSLPGIQCAARHAASLVLPGYALPDLRPLIGLPIFEAIYEVLGEGARSRSLQFETCFRAYYDEVGWKQSVLYPGTAEAMGELRRRNIRCHVVTNKPKLPTGRILGHLGILTYLSGVVSRDSRKPSFTSKAEALGRLMADFAISPEAAIMVGDSADDAHAAMACGIPFVAAAYGYGDYSRPVPGPGLPVPEAVLPCLSGLCSALPTLDAGFRFRRPRYMGS